MAGRFALIVASGAYSDPKLSRLRTPTTDAEALARVLRDPEIGDFEVDLAVDEPESALRRRISTFFSERSRDDLLLLHFSCHGLKDDSGHLYFAATDTEVAQLDATAVSAEFVSRQMTRSRSRKVIALLDCCYSGAIARGLTFRGGDRVDLDDHLGGNGRVILTASSAMEYAFEGEELTGTGNPSVFTTAVVKGLETGEADRDQDHRISVEELYDYVCEQVREVTPDQTPTMLSHLEGELYLARSSYVAPVSAAELPPELRAAIDSPLAGVRVGVVSELERLLAGHDPALAAAARGALAHLTEDDSRRVATAASAALGEEGPSEAAPAAAPAPPAAAAAPARAEPTSRLARWGPVGLSVLGGLLVFAVLISVDSTWYSSVKDSDELCGLAVMVAVAIAALRSAGIRRRGLDAAEAVLAAFPLGLAMAGGGLHDNVGSNFSAPTIAVGSLLMLASVLWRRPQAGRPGWILVGIIVAGSIGLFFAPGLKWWADQLGTDLLLWPLTVGVAFTSVVAVAAVAMGAGGDGVWAALVVAAGAAALFAGLAILNYAASGDTNANTGPWLTLIAGVVVAGAGVYALLRPAPPPGPR
jgi:hypothetical protein